MRKEAIQIEEQRLESINNQSDYRSMHERHRIFPDIFENRVHKKILDVSSGVGIVGRRIKDSSYDDVEVLCNDISPTCLKVMKGAGLTTTSFDIDDDKEAFPFPDKHFDAIVSLATIEHLVYIDHHLNEVYRILKDDGCLYISSPNYAGLLYMLPFILKGRTFHDPLSKAERYEFDAHVKYFTYKSLLEFVSSFGFIADSVYLSLPKCSSKYLELKSNSPVKALIFHILMNCMYKYLSPRWASEPVICFYKNSVKTPSKIKKVIL